jgi:plastocyanin
MMKAMVATVIKACGGYRTMISSNLKAICWILILGLMAGATSAGTITGKVTAKKKKYLPHAVVYIDSVKGDFTPPEKAPVMDQKNMVFHPHVLPVLAGTTVDFLNSDEVAHNVFTPDKTADKFNLGTWPKGEVRSFTFDKRCEEVCDAVMLCNVHPEMEAFVVVMQNPYFSATDEDGNFTIEDIPAGEYTVSVWHPKRKAESTTIVVPDEGAVSLEIALKKK